MTQPNLDFQGSDQRIADGLLSNFPFTQDVGGQHHKAMVSSAMLALLPAMRLTNRASLQTLAELLGNPKEIEVLHLQLPHGPERSSLGFFLEGYSTAPRSLDLTRFQMDFGKFGKVLAERLA